MAETKVNNPYSLYVAGMPNRQPLNNDKNIKAVADHGCKSLKNIKEDYGHEKAIKTSQTINKEHFIIKVRQRRWRL
ncbi:hypothetical protein [Thalassomonas viridans]|uniref:hypothetical protein n=1 Tax=Thalassomonas viridans TaxID=137584 RepID=UPI00128BCBD7|nr:hypothetical protein [Thalassomonas viridans]